MEDCIGPQEVLGQLNHTVIEVRSGSLVGVEAEAIVCPANTFLQMRGGVSALLRIHAGAKNDLEKAAVALGPIRVGDAVITEGFDLKQRVIHAPTVVMPVDRSSPRTVSLATAAALRIAYRHSIRTLATPSLGTGTGGISYEVAAAVMLRELVRHIRAGRTALQRLTFVAYEVGFRDALLHIPIRTVSVEPPEEPAVLMTAKHRLEWASS